MTSKEALEILFASYYYDGNYQQVIEAREKLEQELERLEKLESIEKELGCPLNVLMKASKNGFYHVNDEGNIYFMSHAVLVNIDTFVEVKPCYAVKETTLESCYSGDVSPLKEVKDSHYWDWKTCGSWRIKDYKKTWWLKRDKSE